MTLNHVGLTVGDLDHGVRFYTEACGLKLISGPGSMDGSDPTGAERRRQIFGPRWNGMKLAHLADENGTGVELFEFPEPATESLPEEFRFWRIGVSHLAVTADDMASSRARLEALGGTARTPVFTLSPGVQICYCQDPWGNAIELSTVDYPTLARIASPSTLAGDVL
jgi:catechol 2,3-dioxygenase-like lactoylglutathione lyase family enzyme